MHLRACVRVSERDLTGGGGGVCCSRTARGFHAKGGAADVAQRAPATRVHARRAVLQRRCILYTYFLGASAQ